MMWCSETCYYQYGINYNTLGFDCYLLADHNSLERGSNSFTCHKNNVTKILSHKNVTSKLSQNRIFVQPTKNPIHPRYYLIWKFIINIGALKIVWWYPSSGSTLFWVANDLFQNSSPRILFYLSFEFFSFKWGILEWFIMQMFMS